MNSGLPQSKDMPVSPTNSGKRDLKSFSFHLSFLLVLCLSRLKTIPRGDLHDGRRVGDPSFLQSLEISYIFIKSF